MNVNANGNHRIRRLRPGPAGGTRRLGVFAAVLAGAALLAAACGGGSHPAGSGPTSGQLTTPKLDAFAQCMRSHGIADFYFSQANPSSPDVMFGYAVPASINPRSPQFQTDEKACGPILGLPSGPPPAVTAAQLRRLVRAAECMRVHGYPGYPDPSVQNGGIAVPPLPSSVDTNSPQFQAAMNKCHPAPPGAQIGG
jgi:hypothetical protein